MTGPRCAALPPRCAAGCSGRRCRGGADLGRPRSSDQLEGDKHVAAFVVARSSHQGAAAKTKSAADLYTAGRCINGFQNGLDDCRRLHVGGVLHRHLAAVMVGASTADLFDRLPRRLAGVTFLLAERLRNPGKFTSQTWPVRFSQTPVRVFALGHVWWWRSTGSRNGGAGQLISCCSAWSMARGDRGALMMVYVLSCMTPPPGCRSSRPAC